jgi:hypothetical protein
MIKRDILIAKFNELQQFIKAFEASLAISVVHTFSNDQYRFRMKYLIAILVTVVISLSFDFEVFAMIPINGTCPYTCEDIRVNVTAEKVCVQLDRLEI